MKASFLIVVLAGISTGCGHGDPIERIVKRETANPYFPSGLTMTIELPATASVVEVTSRALGQSITNITILEARRVHISRGDEERQTPPGFWDYTAVRVNTSSGQKVVLLQFQQDSQHPPGSWWSRDYDVQSN
jgi:hypothetical protein